MKSPYTVQPDTHHPGTKDTGNLRSRYKRVATICFRTANHLAKHLMMVAGTSKPAPIDQIYTRLALPAIPRFAAEERLPLGRLNPIQYWSQGTPPSDVIEITKIWNRVLESAGFSCIRLYSRETAYEYICHHQPHLELPFSTAFHYAVEADIFRIAVAASEGCMWLDSDIVPSNRCSEILQEIAGRLNSTYFIWKPSRRSPARITNCFFNATPKCKVMKALCRELSSIDFRCLPKTKDTIAWNGGPKLYQKVINAELGGEYRIRRAKHLASACTSSGQLNFIDDYSLLAFSKAPNLSYTGSNMQWQIAVPDRET